MMNGMPFVKNQQMCEFQLGKQPICETKKQRFFFINCHSLTYFKDSNKLSVLTILKLSCEMVGSLSSAKEFALGSRNLGSFGRIYIQKKNLPIPCDLITLIHPATAIPHYIWCLRCFCRWILVDWTSCSWWGKLTKQFIREVTFSSELNLSKGRYFITLIIPSSFSNNQIWKQLIIT